MPKKRDHHNEWVQPLAKPRCPHCKKETITPVCAWGEYVNGKWRTVDYFCANCADEKFFDRLQSHVNDCGCTVDLCSRCGYSMPAFITNTQFTPACEVASCET